MNHPTRQATARCRRCGRPICNDCKLVSEVGVVCSEMCLDAIKSFQERVGDDTPKRRRLWLKSPAVQMIVAIALVIAAAYGYLSWHNGGMLTVSEFWREVTNLIPFF
jgi:hypothetical protein